MTHRNRFRLDIQALRGLAILLVVLFHAQLGGLSAGYLGVDIFFVISGFLITGVIKDGIETGKFSLGSFYARRAKRLMPAALVTLMAVTLASPWFLLASEATNYWHTLLGSLTFTANIALWLQTGYFEQAAHLKPLLHMWSLAIEEQYYLIWPSLLLFCPRRYWLSALLVLTALSLLLCLVFVEAKPGATFYLLPTRAWELGIGSIAVLLQSRAGLLARWCFWPALAVVLLVPTVVPPGVHPGPGAIAVCVATAVLIIRRHPWLSEGLLTKGLASLGNISYSLYLVHWPLFAFAHNAFVTGIPVSARALLLVIAVGIALLLYRWVELPFWRSRPIPGKRLLSFALAATFCVALSGVAMARFSQADVDFKSLRRPNPGLDPSCDSNDAFVRSVKCSTSASPTMMIWGDSYAEHLVVGIAGTAGRGLVQATRSACGPYLDMAQLRAGDFERPWAQNCIAFNDSVLRFLRDSPAVEVVVLASAFPTYWDDSSPQTKRLMRRYRERVVEVPRSMEATLEGLSATIRAIRALGRKVVVVAPPPVTDFDIGECMERKLSGRIVVPPYGASQDCSIDRGAYDLASAREREFFEKLSQRIDIEVIDFNDVLCNHTTCAVELDGVLVYGFHNHLSYDGSLAVAKRMTFGSKIERLAR